MRRVPAPVDSAQPHRAQPGAARILQFDFNGYHSVWATHSGTIELVSELGLSSAGTCMGLEMRGDGRWDRVR